MIIVDRIEGEFAVCETDNGFVNIPLANIDAKPKDGDVLVLDGTKYVVDKDAVEKRRKAMFLKQNKLFK